MFVVQIQYRVRFFARVDPASELELTYTFYTKESTENLVTTAAKEIANKFNINKALLDFVSIEKINHKTLFTW